MTFSGSSNRGPSTAELQKFIRDKTPVVLLLANGDKVVGQLRWVDETAFQIHPDGQVPFTVLRSAVLGWQRKDAEPGTAAPAAAPAAKASVAASEQPAPAAALPRRRPSAMFGCDSGGSPPNSRRGCACCTTGRWCRSWSSVRSRRFFPSGRPSWRRRTRGRLGSSESWLAPASAFCDGVGGPRSCW